MAQQGRADPRTPNERPLFCRQSRGLAAALLHARLILRVYSDHDMESAEHIFRDFLRERKLKYTTERLAILKSAAHFGRPFEAEELLLDLRESDYRVSKATIYRTLKHLVDAGLLRQVFFGAAKQAHYDFIYPSAAHRGSDHDHLIDLDTGRIVPFSNEAVIKLRDEIARRMGFEAVGHRFQIMGRRQGR